MPPYHPYPLLSQANLTEDEARQQRQKQYGGAWDKAFLPDKIPHLNLVNHQLSQLRTQIVLARELGGAAAILPPFMCGSTKDSFRWDGRVEWSASAIPFRCPADYILDFRACVGRREGLGGRGRGKIVA